MSTPFTDLVRQYRARAEEARVRALEAASDEARTSLLQIADTWERMAAWEEQNPRRYVWTSGDSQI